MNINIKNANKTIVILPNQLFDKKYLPKPNTLKEVIIYEHPHFFTNYNFNKKKLMLHRASMKYYYDYLKEKKYNVSYLEYKDKLPTTQKFKDELLMFDPIDKIKDLDKTISYLEKQSRLIESPNFLLTKKQYQQYRDEKSKKFVFNNFYMWSKELLDIIPKVKSTDKENRQSIPKNIKIPKTPSNKSDKQYIDEASKYIKKHFSKNPGNTENFMYPVTHSTAKKWLKDFIKHKLKTFGPYEDFVDKDAKNNILFHSCLSSSINISLLNPDEIIEQIMPVKSSIPINSFEGYIRQLFWREYQRFTYIHYDFWKENYFGHRKKLKKEWYEGTTGIKPVDDAIKLAFDTGYLHHIIRLMIIGNWMNLTEISPKEGFRWFMEFSCDSYEWVMCQNVLDMVFFVSGGATMRKPYSSSSNYILKMSNYKKDDWCDKWDDTYHKFIMNHKDKLWKFRYHFPALTKKKK